MMVVVSRRLKVLSSVLSVSITMRFGFKRRMVARVVEVEETVGLLHGLSLFFRELGQLFMIVLDPNIFGSESIVVKSVKVVSFEITNHRCKSEVFGRKIDLSSSIHFRILIPGAF